MKHYRFGVPIYISIAFLIAFTAISLICFLLTAVWGDHTALQIEVPAVSYVLLASAILSTITTVLLSRLVLTPMVKLNRALQAVAEGDFSIRLEEKSIIREIRDSCHSFNRMAEQLAATELLQSDFVSNVSHEIKTPVSAIEGYAMLLQGDSKQREYVEKILFNTQRLSQLVGNVLLLSKLDNQTAALKKNAFRLDEQVRYAIVALEPKWSEKEIDFDVDMEEVVFTGNESLLAHVWQNLIDNAIKFDPYGGLVRIRLTESEEDVVFTLRDNGPGIAPAELTRIFGKFYQGDSSHQDQGNGLGLSLVQRIVALHGGRVTVENHGNGGCIFTVRLPKISSDTNS